MEIPTPKIKIVLATENSVPQVFIDGILFEGAVSVSFDWQTKEEHHPGYAKFELSHVTIGDDDDPVPTVRKTGWERGLQKREK